MSDKLVRIKNRYDTAENWGTENPILAAGEIGIDSTNNIIKVGNGTDCWFNLDTINGSNKYFVRNFIDYTDEKYSDMDMLDNNYEIMISDWFKVPIQYAKITINGYHDILINFADCTVTGSSAMSKVRSYKVYSSTDANDSDYGTIYAYRALDDGETFIEIYYKPVFDYYYNVASWKISTVIKSHALITLGNDIDISLNAIGSRTFDVAQ